VRDSAARVVFESGRLDPDASIAGNDNDADRTKFEPHYDVIRSTDKVQIYESILGDTKGAVTTGLLSASQYLKDNRCCRAASTSAPRRRTWRSIAARPRMSISPGVAIACAIPST